MDLVSASAAGIAPASGGGTANFLRADGTWAAPPSGGSASNPTPRIVTSSANATLLATDGLVCFNRTSSPAATTVTLEANPVPGVVHRIKDMAGNAATYPITVQPASGTIDGAANFIISQNRGALTVEFNGSEWSIT